MSTLKAKLTTTIGLVETLTASEAPSAANPALELSGFGKHVGPLSASSTPAIDTQVSISGALTAGAYVLDLTAAPKTGGGTQDLTGKKLVALAFENLGAAVMTVGPDPSNGYAPFGAGASPEFKAGGYCFTYLKSGGVAVAAGVKRIKITGTGTETFKLQLILGP